MPEPNEYLAVLNLQTTLQAMTTGGGYFYTVPSGAVKLNPNHGVDDLIAPDGPRPFIVIEVMPDTFDTSRGSRPNRFEIVLPLIVHWVHDSDPLNDASRLQTFYRGCADVEKAVDVDITRGGKARDTLIKKRTANYAIDGSLVWAEIELEIRLHRLYGQPS